IRHGAEDGVEVDLEVLAASEIVHAERALAAVGLQAQPREDEDEVSTRRENALAKHRRVFVRRLEAVLGASDVPAVKPEDDVGFIAQALDAFRTEDAGVPQTTVIRVEGHAVELGLPVPDELAFRGHGGLLSRTESGAALGTVVSAGFETGGLVLWG